MEGLETGFPATAIAAGVWGGGGAGGGSFPPVQPRCGSLCGYLIGEGLGEGSIAMGARGQRREEEEGWPWLAMGWARFTRLTAQRLRHPSLASRSQICPHPPALPIPRADGTGRSLGGMSQIWPRARGWTRHVPGEHPHPRLDGDRSPGRGPTRGCGKLSLFLFLLSPPPSISWDEPGESVGRHPLASLSPFFLLAGPGVTIPITALRSPSPSPWPLPWPHLPPEQLERGEI